MPYGLKQQGGAGGRNSIMPIACVLVQPSEVHTTKRRDCIIDFSDRGNKEVYLFLGQQPHLTFG